MSFYCIVTHLALAADALYGWISICIPQIHCSFPFLWGLGRGIWFLSELKMEDVRETMWIQQSDENRVEDIPLKM